jgi:hypothetical protein
MRKLFMTFVLGIVLSMLAFAQPVTVTSPHKGDIWKVGETRQVSWLYGSPWYDKVKITLMEGVSEYLIAEAKDQGGSGTYSWTVGQIAGKTPDTWMGYRIRVRTVDDRYGESGEFAIVVPTLNPAILAVTSPHGGETLTRDSYFWINWNQSGGFRPAPGSPPPTYEILLRGQGLSGLEVGTISHTTPGPSFQWSVGWHVSDDLGNGGIAPAGSGYSIRVINLNDPETYGDSGPFTIVLPSLANQPSLMLANLSVAFLAWSASGTEGIVLDLRELLSKLGDPERIDTLNVEILRGSMPFAVIGRHGKGARLADRQFVRLPPDKLALLRRESMGFQLKITNAAGRILFLGPIRLVK